MNFFDLTFNENEDLKDKNNLSENESKEILEINTKENVIIPEINNESVFGKILNSTTGFANNISDKYKEIYDSSFNLLSETTDSISEKSIEIYDSSLSIISESNISISETYNYFTDKSGEFYESSLSFLTETGTSLSESSKQKYITIKDKIDREYDQIEIKNNLFILLSKLDIPKIIKFLQNIKTNNTNSLNALKVTISFLKIFETYKLNLIIENKNNEILYINHTVSEFLSKVDFKEVLREVKPYFLLIPPPYGIAVFTILEIFVD
jgi:hypothetical protein